MANKNVGRAALLLLVLAALAGPWTFTRDGAPPAEWCSSSHILLENGRCGSLVTGAGVLSLVVANLPSIAVALVSEGLPVFQVVASVGILLLLLPLLSTLLRIPYGDGRRLHLFYLLSWGLAIVPSLWLASFTLGLRSTRFWVIWLYIALAAGVLTLEIVVPATRRRFRQASP